MRCTEASKYSTTNRLYLSLVLALRGSHRRVKAIEVHLLHLSSALNLKASVFRITYPITRLPSSFVPTVNIVRNRDATGISHLRSAPELVVTGEVPKTSATLGINSICRGSLFTFRRSRAMRYFELLSMRTRNNSKPRTPRTAL